ncbi:MAG: glycosyltransferase family 2 protein [Rickettsiales bacterium]|nr:glycosyltransferase family 2 protein [Rickettsiales bacterium]
MSSICVIIVNYNSGAYLRQCLDALENQTFTNFEVIIVDNNSDDDSLVKLGDYPKLSLQIVCNASNEGFAAANNKAAAMTDAPLLAFLNPDAFAAHDWLQQLYDHSLRFAEFSMFGSTQICADNAQKLDGTGDLYHIFGILIRGNYQNHIRNLPETSEVFAPCAAASMIRRDEFHCIGGFDERFFCYCEDVDLAFRLRLSGERCLQVKEATVYHKGSAITGIASDFSIYHGMRNRIWVFLKNMPLALLIPLLPIHLALQLLFLARAARKGKLSPALKGLKDALVNIRPILKSRKTIHECRFISLKTLLKSFTYAPSSLFKRSVKTAPVSRNNQDKHPLTL